MCLLQKEWEISFTEFSSLVLPPLPVSFYPQMNVSRVCYQCSQILHYFSSLGFCLPARTKPWPFSSPSSFVSAHTDSEGFPSSETCHHVFRFALPVDTQTGKSMWNGGRDGGDVATSQGTAEPEEARKESPQVPLEGPWLCQYLDLWPPELWEKISDVFRHQVYCNLLGQP